MKKVIARVAVLAAVFAGWNILPAPVTAQDSLDPTPKTELQPIPFRQDIQTHSPENTASSEKLVPGADFASSQVLLVNRQYPEAIQAFQQVLMARPDYVPALNGLAMALYHQGRYEEALSELGKAMALDPVNSLLFYTQARIKDAQNKPVEALQSYLTFTALNPNDGAAIDAQRRAGELYKTLESNLSPAEQALFQGERLLSLRQPADAIPLLKQYQSLRPDDTQAQLMLGQAYLQLGQPEKAIPQYESAIKVKPDNASAYYQLGNSYELQGQQQNARQAYLQFLKQAPQSEAAMLIQKRVGEPY